MAPNTTIIHTIPLVNQQNESIGDVFLTPHAKESVIKLVEEGKQFKIGFKVERVELVPNNPSKGYGLFITEASIDGV